MIGALLDRLTRDSANSTPISPPRPKNLSAIFSGISNQLDKIRSSSQKQNPRLSVSQESTDLLFTPQQNTSAIVISPASTQKQTNKQTTVLISLLVKRTVLLWNAHFTFYALTSIKAQRKLRRKKSIVKSSTAGRRTPTERKNTRHMPSPKIIVCLGRPAHQHTGKAFTRRFKRPHLIRLSG